MSELLTPSFVIESATPFYDAATDGSGNLYYLLNNNKVGGVNLGTGTALKNGSTVTLQAGSASLAIVGASAVVVTTSAAAATVVELSSFYTTDFGTSGTWSAVRTAGKPTQIAYNATSNYAMAVSSTAGTYLAYAVGSATPAKLTLPSPSNADSVECIIAKTGTSNFLVGTNKGYVYEVTTAGSVIRHVQIPVTNKVIAAATITWPMTSMNYSANTDTLTASLGQGLLFTWNLGASSLTDMRMVSMCGESATRGGISMSTCLSASGQVVWSQYGGAAQTRTNKNQVTVASYDPHGILQIEARYRAEDDYALSTGIDYSVNKCWVVSKDRIYVYNIIPPLSYQVPTRLQDPAGTDVAGRVIRIRDGGPGNSYVYSDQSVSSGEVNLPALQSGEYYEIALTGTSPNYKWDWRKFNL